MNVQKYDTWKKNKGRLKVKFMDGGKKLEGRKVVSMSCLSTGRDSSTMSPTSTSTRHCGKIWSFRISKDWLKSIKKCFRLLKISYKNLE